MANLYNTKPMPTGWQAPIDHWLSTLRARGLRPASLETRRRHMAYFARCNPGVQPQDMTPEAVLAWASTMAWQPETRHAYYATFKSFLDWQGTASNGLPRVHRPRAIARPVPEIVVQEIINHRDPRIALGARLAASAGLRRAEIARVAIEDLSEDLLGRSLTVKGKGGVMRLVPLSEALDTALRSYVHREHITGYLFPGDHKGHVGSAWLGKLINQELPKPWTLHGLRHRFATRVYQTTGSIIAVQNLLGHASVATTQRYIAIAPDHLRQAVNLVDAA